MPALHPGETRPVEYTTRRNIAASPWTRAVRALVVFPSLRAQRTPRSLGCAARQPQLDGKRVAAIGFCFGGTTALELMRSGAPPRGSRDLPSGSPELPETRRARARLLVCHGARSAVKKEAVDALMANCPRQVDCSSSTTQCSAQLYRPEATAQMRHAYEKRRGALLAAMRHLFDERSPEVPDCSRQHRDG